MSRGRRRRRRKVFIPPEGEGAVWSLSPFKLYQFLGAGQNGKGVISVSTNIPAKLKLLPAQEFIQQKKSDKKAPDFFGFNQKEVVELGETPVKKTAITIGLPRG